ncbi:MAG: low specificity L-threonine aldolase [Mesorhizobium sp.]|uniref:threonine aldolase family protein n=1 Tax=unclassified Mesorhizobium TaxID=325217 RepID=UPI000FC9E9CA|nr:MULTISPECIES: low specificity L-threonine aldolase [unclassified Mesorhizobium]RUW83327.1 low specificity L-threonine aldolase [Mesorhizobium sp. M1E.F.Ca.ET.063.01.1.1]TIW08901.1 MAG: low specificity L-threonine aldolase [Mesorhizobium sp.]
MDFRSDNVSSVSPEILNDLVTANQGTSTSYAEDDLTRAVTRKLQDVFEHPVRFFPVLTGTASNALALSILTPPYGGIFCSDEAHIYYDECAAPEFFTGGAKLIGLPSLNGRISAAGAEKAIAKGISSGIHHAKPSTVSITQATELGTVYSPDEVRAIASIAQQFGMHLHMDGARFANAVASLNVSPADLTWRAGVDVLCLGATKNGALSAEGVVIFNKDIGDDLGYRVKRSGHLASKSRFISSQWLAYLTDNLWLKNATWANAMAQRLSAGVAALPMAKIVFPTEANEVFVSVGDEILEGLKRRGVRFSEWPADEGTVLRFVTSFNTPQADVDACVAAFVATGCVPV